MSSGYVPSEDSIKFIAFIRACNIEDNVNPEIHYKLADKLFDKGTRDLVIESFRGSAKSSLVEWFVIYLSVTGKLSGIGDVNFIAFVGDSAQNGVKNFFRNIGGKIDKSELLRSLVDLKRCTESEAEIVNKNGHQLNIKGYGASTNIRGVRYNNERPQIVIADDITTNDALTSDIIQNTINDNFYKALIPAMHPTKYKMIVIGTPISEKDLIHQLSNNSEWSVHRVPICDKFPCEPKEFKGAWEDRFPYEAVRSKYKMFESSGKLKDFYQEYMLEVTDLSTLLVEDSDIKWYEYGAISFKSGAYNLYIATDFATSTKKSADYSVICVFGISNDNGWFVVDGQCKRQSMSDNINDLFKYVRLYNPLSVGIETSGQQGGFISILEEQMMKRNTWFTLAKKEGSKEVGIRPIKDKVHRFVTGVQPKFKQNKIWLPREEGCKKSNYKLYEFVVELMNELRVLTLAGGLNALTHDDCVDVFNQFSEMEKFVPSGEDVVITSFDSNEEVSLFGPADDLNKYGRSTIF